MISYFMHRNRRIIKATVGIDKVFIIRFINFIIFLFDFKHCNNVVNTLSLPIVLLLETLTESTF